MEDNSWVHRTPNNYFTKSYDYTPQETTASKLTNPAGKHLYKHGIDLMEVFPHSESSDTAKAIHIRDHMNKYSKTMLIYPDDANGVQCFPGDVVTPIEGNASENLYQIVAIVDNSQIYIRYFDDKDARPYVAKACKFKHCKYPELSETIKQIVLDVIDISGFNETHNTVSESELNSIVKFATKRLSEYLNDKYKLDI